MEVPIYRPELPPYEIVEPDIRAMYTSGMLYPGIYTERLIDKVKEFCRVQYVLPVSSCSMGLILMLNVLPKLSKVIMPAFTFNATLQALEWNNLIPVVVDVDDNGQLRPDLVKDCLAEHPHNLKAILPVHMWGNLIDVEEFSVLADMGNSYLFVDGAHALGSFEQGSISIQPGDATCFSIAATKPVSAGEGGLIVTNSERVYFTLRDSATHGLYGSLDTKVRGINGKIQEFNSILAYHALGRFNVTKARRKEVMEAYRSGLKDLPLKIWQTREGVDASYKDCVLFTETESVRNRLDHFLQSRNIGTKRYFEPAIPDMGSFEGLVHSAENARRLASTCLTIPLYPALTDIEVEYVIAAVKECFN